LALEEPKWNFLIPAVLKALKHGIAILGKRTKKGMKWRDFGESNARSAAAGEVKGSLLFGSVEIEI
jgi:hypothetical protein